MSASLVLQVKQIEKRDSVLTSKNQIDRLTRPGSSYFNLNPFEVGLNALSSLLTRCSDFPISWVLISVERLKIETERSSLDVGYSAGAFRRQEDDVYVCPGLYWVQIILF